MHVFVILLGKGWFFAGPGKSLADYLQMEQEMSVLEEEQGLKLTEFLFN